MDGFTPRTMGIAAAGGNGTGMGSGSGFTPVAMQMSVSQGGLSALGIGAGAMQQDQEEERRRRMESVVGMVGREWGFVSLEGVERASRRLGMDFEEGTEHLDCTVGRRATSSIISRRC